MRSDRNDGALDGRIAIVTGASRGIGLAIAKSLVHNGARVCITSRHIENLNLALSEFPVGAAIAVAGNADDALHRREVFDSVANQFGHLDILVNNVGINPAFGRLIDLDLDAARRIVEMNLLSTLAWIQEAYHHQQLAFWEGGNIVNISSVTAQRPSPGIGMYGVSKAAIDHLTRTLAVEMGPLFRVNAVSPAVITTQFSRALYEGKEEEVMDRYPLKRLGTVEDVASLVTFLVSPSAEWITGQVVTLDGGLLSGGGVA